MCHYNSRWDRYHTDRSNASLCLTQASTHIFLWIFREILFLCHVGGDNTRVVYNMGAKVKIFGVKGNV